MHNAAGCAARLYFSRSGGLPRIEAAAVAPAQRALQAWHLLAALRALLFLGNLLFGHRA